MMYAHQIKDLLFRVLYTHNPQVIHLKDILPRETANLCIVLYNVSYERR